MGNKKSEKILGSVGAAIVGVLSGIILKLVVSLVFLFIYLEKIVRIYF